MLDRILLYTWGTNEIFQNSEYFFCGPQKRGLPKARLDSIFRACERRLAGTVQLRKTIALRLALSPGHQEKEQTLRNAHRLVNAVGVPGREGWGRHPRGGFREHFGIS